MQRMGSKGAKYTKGGVKNEVKGKGAKHTKGAEDGAKGKGAKHTKGVKDGAKEEKHAKGGTKGAKDGAKVQSIQRVQRMGQRAKGQSIQRV